MAVVENVEQAMEKMDFRCSHCGRLLARTNGDTEIKCPRCGAINLLTASTGDIKCIPKDQQRRVTSSGMTFI